MAQCAHQKKEKDYEFKGECPADEGEYAHKYKIDITVRKKKMEKTSKNLEKLLNEHEKMYIAHGNNVTQPKEEKFPLDILNKLQENSTEDEQKFNLHIIKFNFLLWIGNWYMKMGNLQRAKEYFNMVRKKITPFRCGRRIKQLRVVI